MESTCSVNVDVSFFCMYVMMRCVVSVLAIRMASGVAGSQYFSALVSGVG